MMPNWFNFARLWQFCRRISRITLLLTLFGLPIGAVSLVPVVLHAQETQPVQQAEDQIIRQFALPEAPAQPPVYRSQPAAPAAPPPSAPPPAAPPPSAPPASNLTQTPSETESSRAEATEANTEETPMPDSEYVWEFNRYPEMGNRIRLEGVYPTARFGFTRPRNWEVQSAKAVIQFRQSASLLPEKSNLTVRINDTSVGTVPLNRTNGQIGNVAFDIPPSLIQPQNEIAILAEQQTSESCTNPNTPTLWTEILPASKLVYTYRTQTIPLDFSRYPYPIVDEYNPDPNQIAYLRPQAMTSEWLTAVSRFQAQLGRLLDYRPVRSRVIDNISQLTAQEQLVVLGTPNSQPLLANLELPFTLNQGKILDGQQKPLPDDVGVLMLTTLEESDRTTPVLVATGNATSGMTKAVQFLVQAKDRQIGTGQAITVNNLEEMASQNPRSWIGHLPNANRFKFSDLTLETDRYFVDTTVHGSNPAAIAIPFQALPGDRIARGSTITLDYTYGPQLNPRTSAVEVALDDITLGAERLSSKTGGSRSFTVNLPDDVVRPDSKLYVRFVLNPLQNGVCGIEAEQQLWGTVHSTSHVNLTKDTVTRLPDLNLLRVGYPLAAPQDLSTTALILPDRPTNGEFDVFLSFSRRLGQITQSDSIKLNTYLAKDLPAQVKAEQNLVAIGVRDRLPTPEALVTKGGLNLHTASLRQMGATQVQAIPDGEGVVKAVLSPWNENRLLLALTAQRDQGLRDVQDLLDNDRLFGQLQGDTTLIHRNQPDPNPYDREGYSITSLNNAPQERTVVQASFMGRLVMFFQNHWLLLPVGIVLLPLLLYGFSQIFLNHVANGGTRS
ncbi:cellulose biosynthesis cyclic di-GMP-binding regulatory protein BcsB [Egbenema bharatensis]|uniref:cellulose biosynthesis cyclic di-GMP-binding regulatory protein BcsB n=1 Tax=Egbenema bharatensis TaxID=3463334 RepID=UPI003A858F22